jgi:hypothetical protein
VIRKTGTTKEALETERFQTRMRSNAPELGHDRTKIGNCALEMKHEQMEIGSRALAGTSMKTLFADCRLQNKHKTPGLEALHG